ncbi:MAG: cytochrome b/b6 domain-containing protein [Shewanella sp.]|nr:cytochrome b/b6 domain-containing protein [Shewanella sp.]MCF1431419.1 cytochrome b/b6 domain-containing protein [Shewanella sp.]MCF1439734.1 cytochrome b/b6 domain-containing protein [Shewanella sp.]MCF1458897.1 cytochrome b/b6 domain-containing protein [Shewanella sp.]
MTTTASHEQQIRYIRTWDLSVRLFHWINALCIMGLSLLGLVMMFKPELGISGLDAKIGLKQAHSLVGYVFVANLLLRILWGFVGTRFARFGDIFRGAYSPRGISEYLSETRSGHSPQYLGHNPLGKPMVVCLFVLLVIMGATGLFRAGTDIYFPPFGKSIQRFLAAPDTNPADLKPYLEPGVDKQQQQALAPYKKWTGKAHVWGFYLLMVLVLLHISGAIITECRHQPGIISAMFSGKKPIAGKAADE